MDGVTARAGLDSTPVRVLKNTAVFTVLGATTGSLLGVVKNVPAIPAALTTGLRTGIFSFIFFSLRDYIIVPTLAPLQPATSPSSPMTYRLSNLHHTFLAGTLAGTSFAYFARAQFKGSPRAGMTLGIACTAVQIVTNELEITRVKMLGWAEERQAILDSNAAYDASHAPSDPPSASRLIPTYTRSINDPLPTTPGRETFSERSDRLFSGAFEGLTERLASLSPLKKMGDGEYTVALEKRLQEVENERAELQKEVEELNERRKE